MASLNPYPTAVTPAKALHMMYGGGGRGGGGGERGGLMGMERMGSLRGVDLSHTTGVGTFFYISPEQERKLDRSGQYDEKVDIYSLGVIFFEMWCPFATAHERYTVLNNIRLHCTFPPGFEETHPRQVRVIRWLLNEDPANRPTAMELLQSAALPPTMQDEYFTTALRIVSDPTTTHYHRILSAMFQASTQSLQGKRHSFGSNLPGRGKFVSARQEIVRALAAVFELHGAVEQNTPVISPDSSVQSEGGVSRDTAVFLNRSGILYRLRYDLRMPFIQQVLSNQIAGPIKRFEIGPVYRADPLGQASDHKEIIQADFDILAPADGAHITLKTNPESDSFIMAETFCVREAEALTTLLSALTNLPIEPAPNFFIRLSHTRLLPAILTECGVGADRIQTAIRIVGQVNRVGWNSVREELAKTVGISARQADKLGSFVSLRTVDPYAMLAELSTRLSATPSYSPGPSLTPIRSIDQSTHSMTSVEHASGIHALRSVLLLAEAAGASMAPIIIDPTILLDSTFVGIIFRADIQYAGLAPPGECVAIGGRFDQSVHRAWAAARYPDSPADVVLSRHADSLPRVHAVGFSIAVEKLAVSAGRAVSVSRDQDPGSGQILVGSIGDHMLAARIQVAGDCWKAGVRADFLPTESPTLAEQLDYAQDLDIQWILWVNHKTPNVLKLKHVSKKTEIDVPRNEVVKFFVNLGRRKHSFI